MSDDSSKRYEELKQLLNDNLADATREQEFAIYGYVFAFYDMQLITLDEFHELRSRLSLSATNVEDLKL